jgi:ABC-type phosphate transport system auxiliary subunit
VQQEHIDQEKEELKKEVEGLNKRGQQLKQELSGLKDLTKVGPGQQKVKIPANEITKVLINRAMKMGAKYFELSIENGIAKLPRTKV